MSNEIANIIRETLHNYTANEISKHIGLNLSTIKKWEHLIEKLNLHDAICLLNLALKIIEKMFKSIYGNNS